jgi:hypothetical protein
MTEAKALVKVCRQLLHVVKWGLGIVP